MYMQNKNIIARNNKSHAANYYHGEIAYPTMLITSLISYLFSNFISVLLQYKL